MIAVRRAEARGHFDFGWLDTFHTFSFGEYYDPTQMGFRALRVLNEDRVQPGRGFPTHGHRDMEIVSYVLEGALQHRDSLGNGSVIRPGQVQRMTAGTGVTHSEFNPSEGEPVHFLQIWIVPDRRGYPPSYEQRTIPDADKRGTFRLLAGSPDSGSLVTIHQDVRFFSLSLERDQEVLYEIRADCHAWVQVAHGAVTLDGQPLWEGDGAAVSEQSSIRLIGIESAELLVFDLS